jgi:hypothetical protein
MNGAGVPIQGINVTDDYIYFPSSNGDLYLDDWIFTAAIIKQHDLHTALGRARWGAGPLQRCICVARPGFR